MSDREKVKAICLYVLDSIEYDITYLDQSNIFPLTCVLDNGKGVCASYAYMTNVLLNKAGIKSFQVIDDSHGWNIIELDGEYYYVDTTNMDGSSINKMLLELFNISKNYMIDPEYTTLSAMSNASSEETIIMANLVDDIIKGSSNKDIFEKYGGMVLSGSFSLVSFIIGCFVGFNIFLLMTGKYVEIGKEIYSSIKDDYLDRLFLVSGDIRKMGKEPSVEMTMDNSRYININGDKLIIEPIRDKWTLTEDELVDYVYNETYGRRKSEGYKRKRITESRNRR